MKWNEEDLLRRENWAEVYPDVPPCVENGMNMAFNRIRAQRRQVRKWRTAAACAACAVLALGAGIWAIQPDGNAPDRIADPHIQAPVSMQPEEKLVLEANTAVFTNKQDEAFHIRRDCAAAQEEMVELPLVTAQEFGKTACGHCCANAEFVAESMAETW